MLEQPLPERISFIRGFLQSKSLRRGKRLLGACHPFWGSGFVSAGSPPALSDPPSCISNFTRCRQACPRPAAASGKESFPMEILARARAWRKGGPGGAGQRAGGRSGGAALGHSSPSAWPQAAQIPLEYLYPSRKPGRGSGKSLALLLGLSWKGRTCVPPCVPPCIDGA